MNFENMKREQSPGIAPKSTHDAPDTWSSVMLSGKRGNFFINRIWSRNGKWATPHYFSYLIRMLNETGRILFGKGQGQRYLFHILRFSVSDFHVVLMAPGAVLAGPPKNVFVRHRDRYSRYCIHHLPPPPQESVYFVPSGKIDFHSIFQYHVLSRRDRRPQTNW